MAVKQYLSLPNHINMQLLKLPSGAIISLPESLLFAVYYTPETEDKWRLIQSTYNPNMPVRGMIYYGKLYEAYLERKGKRQYSTVLLDSCKPLADYTELVRRISSGCRKGMTKEEIVRVVDDAVKSCIRDGILVDFLAKHRAEVSNYKQSSPF